MVLIAFFILGYEIFSSYFFRPAPTPVTEKEQTAPSQTPPEEEKPSKEVLPSQVKGIKGKVKTVKFEVGGYRIEIALEGGRIYSFVDNKFGFDLVSPAEKELGILPLTISTGDEELDKKINSYPYSVKGNGNTIVMRLESPIKVEKKLEYRDGYFLLSVQVAGVDKFYVLAGSYPFEESFYTHEGPVLNLGGEVIRIDTDEVRGRLRYEGEIEFAGEESRYFFKGFKGKIRSVVIDSLRWKSPEGDEKDLTFTHVLYGGEPLHMYMGAKYYSRIRELGLSELLDWGMLKIIVKPLFIFMYWVFEHTGSWILSIIILTFILRILFFPLNYKSTVAMMKLSEAAPRLEKIRKKYKDDPKKMQEEMMKLYSEIGFNPMSGCLPILVQIPVFFALYKVLIITVDLKLSGMIWIPSLAEKDPFYVLPVIMGLSMILQQKLTPNPDPKQNMIMYISAVAFTFLFASFPAGLVLYWTVNNILNIAQNYLIKNVILKGKS
jgi:YidC/Oxa1 family membrane protein insertase